MLNSAEKSLVQREAEIAGLGTLLDPEAWVAALREAIGGREILGATRRYVRYKAGANCLTAYEMRTPGGVFDVYGKAHGADADIKFAKIRDRGEMRSPLGPGILLLEPQGLAIWFFPNDSKLAGLTALCDADRRSELLRELLPNEPELHGGELRTLQYKPERRYVARLEVEGEPRAALKLYTRDGYRDARRRALVFRDGAVLRIPRTLGRSSHPGVVVTAWIHGRRLKEALADPAFDPADMARVGAALHELHRQDPRDRIPLRRPRAEISILFDLARNLGHLLPELEARAQALARRLASLLVENTPSLRPIHGDFYANQILLDDEQVSFLDLDGVMLASPLVDLGVFVAHLERDVLRGRIQRGTVEPLTQALLDGYGRAGISGPGLELHTALGLFRLAHDPFRHCEPEWPERTQALLERTDEILGRAEKGKGPERCSPRTPPRPAARVPVADPFDVTHDAKMPFLSAALEPAAVERALAHCKPLGGSCRLGAIRVNRYRPGRRCVIEYDLMVDGPEGSERVPVIAKVRAKRLDPRTPQVSSALVRAGLGPRSAGRVSVPEPLGSVPAWNMWLQRRARGVPATRLLPEPGGVVLAVRIAQAIHRLHEAGVPSSKSHTIADEIRILRERLPVVAERHPEWRGRIERVLEASDRLGQALLTSHPVGLHRDFYPDHVLVEGERLHIIDLDLYAHGDRALDAGNFSAHLVEFGLRGFQDPAHLDAARQAFEARFLELAGEEHRTALETYRTLTLVRHIYISTRISKRNRLTERLLELSEQALSRSAPM